MSYWNKAEKIFDDDGFMVFWGKLNSTDNEKTLGIAWTTFPKQERKNRPAPVVIPNYLHKAMLNGLLKYGTDNNYPLDKIKKITDTLDEQK